MHLVWILGIKFNDKFDNLSSRKDLKDVKSKLLNKLDESNQLSAVKTKQISRGVAFVGELFAWLIFAVIFSLVGMLIFGLFYLIARYVFKMPAMN